MNTNLNLNKFCWLRDSNPRPFDLTLPPEFSLADFFDFFRRFFDPCCETMFQPIGLSKTIFNCHRSEKLEIDFRVC